MQSTDIVYRPRGFFAIAQNSADTNYVRLAYALALSLKASQRTIPYLTIGVTPGTVIPEEWLWAFDNIIDIPWGDDAADADWKLANEWKVVHMTPYDETIKLDCDMLILNDMSAEWDALQYYEFNICNRVVDYRSIDISNDHYRKVFTTNKLPNVYSALMYFKKTAMVYKLFDIVKDIFDDWPTFSTDLLAYTHRPKLPTTDVVIAMALKILDIDQHCYSTNTPLTFVHMKTHLQSWNDTGLTENWTTHITALLNDSFECKIGNHRQQYPLHYHIKEFVTDDIIGQYERHFK